MKIVKNRCFRGVLLSAAYLLGAMGIVATGGDGDNIERRSFCDLIIQSIAPATDASGDIWVGAVSKTAEGDHHSVNRLRSDGSEKASYSLGYAAGEELVQTLAVAADPLNANKVYVGGDFSGGILRLNADGTEDGSFVVGSGFDGRVTSIVADNSSGDIYVGGFFNSYNGTLVGGLVRLNSDGSLLNFAAGASSIESVALAVDSGFQGDIYSAGVTGVDRWNHLLINEPDFDPLVLFSAFSVTPAADESDAIYVSRSAPIGIVRLNGQFGSVDGGFATTGSGFDSDVLSVIRADDMTGDIYAGGRFTIYDGGSANGIVRLNGIDGSRNVNFLIGNGFTNAPDDPSPLSTVSSLARATDGSTDVYVGGGFAFYNGTPSNGILRLNDDGSLDTGFAVEIVAERGLCTNNTIRGLN